MIDQLKRAGMSTIFILEDLQEHAAINEFESFDPTSLLFINSVQEVELFGLKKQLIKISSQSPSIDGCKSRVSLNDSHTDWLVHKSAGNAIAIRIENGKPSRLKQADAIAHAFLPTNESTGVGVKVNGDFSTDPSRTKIVLDNRSLQVCASVAELILKRIVICIKNESAHELQALLPIDDLRLADLGRPSFRRALSSSLLKCGAGRFSNFKLRP